MLKKLRKTLDGKTSPCSENGRMNLVEMGIPLRAIYKFNTIPVKTPGPLLTDIKWGNDLQIYIASHTHKKQKQP